VTLLQVGVRPLRVARIATPLPNAGEGWGVRGYLSVESILETRPLDEVPRMPAKSPTVCSPPHPPNLSRVGERGTEVQRVFRETKSISLYSVTINNRS
jgi:hypothetical protein